MSGVPLIESYFFLRSEARDSTTKNLRTQIQRTEFVFNGVRSFGNGNYLSERKNKRRTTSLEKCIFKIYYIPRSIKDLLPFLLQGSSMSVR